MRAFLLSALFVLSPSALAHDLWLVASPNHLDRPGAITESLAVGHPHRPEDVYPADDLRPVLRYTLSSSAGARDLGNELQWTDDRSIDLPEPGTYLIGMEREPSIARLDPETFHHYLEEEDRLELLDHPAAGRAEIRERFSRHLKQLVQVGERNDGSWSTILGHRIEIVPLSDPLATAPGDTIEVRVLFEGEPIGGLPISIHGRDGSSVLMSSAITGSDGTARLEVPSGDELLIRTVHIRPAAGNQVEFESFWTTLSYAVD